MDMKADSSVGTSRAARSRVEASSDEARAVVSHPVEPALPIRIGRRIDRPQQGLPNGFYAGETKDAPLEPAQPVRSEEGSVDQRRHTHRDDELRRPSGQQPSAESRVYDIRDLGRLHRHRQGLLILARCVRSHSGGMLGWVAAYGARWVR